MSQSFKLAAFLLLGLALAGAEMYLFMRNSAMRPPGPPSTNRVSAPVPPNGGTKTEELEVIEVTDYKAPEDPESLLTDDKLEDKHPAFDPELIDRRPAGDWNLNLSDAVLALNVPLTLPDTEPQLLTLHPSYAAALRSVDPQTHKLLPSVNLIDGKAKQFDDGLYAAIDEAYYKGHEATLVSHVQLIRRMFDKAGVSSPAAPWLAAGLSLAGQSLEAGSNTEQLRIRQRFLGNEPLSKPISFYTWNPTLSDCFRFLRFFQQPITDQATAKALRQVLADDPALLADTRKAVAFYSKLTNPPASQSLVEFVGKPEAITRPIPLFPSSTSRESELFKKLFPLGLPPNANLMKELITKIRSGEVDLKPGPHSGWYDYQAYALETLLLPEKGQEHEKLLLSKSYKKRMLEAFKALITKRRETHARTLEMPAAMAAPPRRLELVEPRLRLEPAPTYYLRTARAYAFLEAFLTSTLGEETLTSLHGLRKEGHRDADLATELRAMRELFYGFYLLSAEDIGLKPTFLDGETVDRAACETIASTWLAKFADDQDIGIDTRVSVPVYFDPNENLTHLWATIGVRLTKLDARFARPPRARPKDAASGDWVPLDPDQCLDVQYLIPVDEFAEVALRGARVLNRDELRAICDQHKTRAAIVEALEK